MSRNQVTLRYVIIPADRSSPVAERMTKVENIRLSCDSAYYIPTLLRDGPSGFSDFNNFNMILPFPTFNECQKDNVPLFFFRRSESRDKQENVRAKILLDAFSEKLSKRQNTFYGDVLVFWRRNVDETRHQMKLSDFTVSDIQKLLGSKINPIITESEEVISRRNSAAVTVVKEDHPKPSGPDLSSSNGLNETNRKPEQTTMNKLLSNAPSQFTHSTSNQSNRSYDQPQVTTESNEQQQQQQQQHSSDHHEPNTSNTKVRGSSSTVTDRSSSHVVVAMKQQSTNPQGIIPVPYSEDLFFSSNEVMMDSTVPESIKMLRRFFESLAQQLPVVTGAVDNVIANYQVAQAIAAASTNDARLTELNNLLLETGAKERRFSTELTKLSTELSQLTAINAQLSRKNQVTHQDLLASQTQTQSYREETGRLMREISLLKEEIVLLRETNQVLDTELRRRKQQQQQQQPDGNTTTTSGLQSLTSSPTNHPVTPNSRRPLHHVKSTAAGTVALPGSPKRADDGNNVVPNTAPSSTNPPTAWESRGSMASGRKFVVAQPYSSYGGAPEERFANLNAGDIVTVDREDDSGWWWVTNGLTSGSGWFPYSFLKPLN